MPVTRGSETLPFIFTRRAIRPLKANKRYEQRVLSRNTLRVSFPHTLSVPSRLETGAVRVPAAAFPVPVSRMTRLSLAPRRLESRGIDNRPGLSVTRKNATGRGTGANTKSNNGRVSLGLCIFLHRNRFPWKQEAESRARSLLFRGASTYENVKREERAPLE